eukprot:403371879
MKSVSQQLHNQFSNLLKSQILKLNPQQFKDSIVISNSIIDKLMDNLEEHIINEKVKFLINPFTTQYILDECLQIVNYSQFKYDQIGLKLSTQEVEDSELEPIPSAIDKTQYDRINLNIKSIVNAGENSINNQSPGKQSQDFNTFEYKSMRSMASRRLLRSKKNTSALSKSKQLQIDKSQIELGQKLIQEIIPLQIKGMNDDEDSNVAEARRLFNVRKSIDKSKENTREPDKEWIGVSTIIPARYRFQELAQDNQKQVKKLKTLELQQIIDPNNLVDQIYNNIFEANNNSSIKRSNVDRDIRIPIDRYNPSTGMIIKSGVKFQEKTLLLEGGEYQNSNQSLTKFSMKQFEEISSKKKYAREFQKEQEQIIHPLHRLQTINIVSSQEVSMRQPYSNLSRSNVEFPDALSQDGKQSQTGKRLSNRQMRNSIQINSNTQIMYDHPNSQHNQSINYLESIRSSHQIANYNPLVNIQSSSQFRLENNQYNPYVNMSSLKNKLAKQKQILIQEKQFDCGIESLSNKN